jgi:hypothetical protein
MLEMELPGGGVVEHKKSWGTVFELPVPPGAEYRFSITTSEPQIHAVPLGPHGDKSFWYWAFEDPSYGSINEQEVDFFAGITRILRHPTRITQHKRLLGHSFLCECEEGGSWTPIGGLYSCLFTFKVPSMSGRHRIYSSPALAQVQANISLQADRER